MGKVKYLRRAAGFTPPEPVGLRAQASLFVFFNMRGEYQPVIGNAWDGGLQFVLIDVPAKQRADIVLRGSGQAVELAVGLSQQMQTRESQQQDFGPVGAGTGQRGHLANTAGSAGEL